jgi:hypothetical protein
LYRFVLTGSQACDPVHAHESVRPACDRALQLPQIGGTKPMTLIN